jgi:DNA mismatch repair protein MutL
MVRKAYGEMLPSGMHPAFFLFFEIDPLRVDVNVHPAKREVRLLDESQFFPLIQESLDAALKGDMPLAMQQSRFQAPAVYRHNLDRVDVLTGELLLEAPPLPAKEYPVFASELSGSDQPISRTAPSGSQPRGGGFRPLRHFGIIGGVFILAEDAEGLCIIDQHTAHERINYERIRKALARRPGARQMLLQPTLVSCLPDELDSILAQRQTLEAAGFVVDAAGPRSLALPEYIAADESSDLFARLIAGVIAGESEIDLFDNYAAIKACKASIKRNDYVAGETLSEILRQLAECEDPSRCPHGRPTMMRISISDLDAMFQRSS